MRNIDNLPHSNNLLGILDELNLAMGSVPEILDKGVGVAAFESIFD